MVFLEDILTILSRERERESIPGVFHLRDNWACLEQKSVRGREGARGKGGISGTIERGACIGGSNHRCLLVRSVGGPESLLVGGAAAEAPDRGRSLRTQPRQNEGLVQVEAPDAGGYSPADP